ncbi:MAG: hypothetical protein R2708_25770 [Vicinamibacterales bacterium]
MAALNPNGTATYGSRTSQLDFVKAFVSVTPRPGLSLKVGREQADGLDLGLSRKLAGRLELRHRAQVVRSGLAALGGPADRCHGFVASPVDNQPYAFNQRRPGETFWGLQSRVTTSPERPSPLRHRPPHRPARSGQ